MKEGALHDLPEGWVLTRLGDIVNDIEKVNPKETPDKEFIYLDIASIDNSQQKITNPKKYLGENAPSRARQLVKTEDILFSSVRTYLKNIAFVNEIYDNQIASTGFCVIRPHNLINKRMIFYLVQTNFFLNPLTQIQRGTNYPAVRESDVLDQIVPLPPLSEQRAIVSKIEQLFSDLDNGIENFKEAQAQLKLYRQSVLKAACEGKLVPTEAELAHSEGRDYEAADILLARILKERREKWNGKGKYRETEAPDRRGLPEGWIWTQTGEICEGVVPGRTKPKEFKGEIPWITLPDIRGFYISKSQKNLGVTKKDAEKVGMKVMPKGSVLISCVGQFGIICIAGCPVVPNQQLHGFICPDFIIPEYVAYSLMTQIEQMNNLSAATTIAYINKTKCNSITIPLPPLAEQRRIVAEVERRLSVSDKMEATITESLQKAESLRQSILKKAFEGKLLNKKEMEKARNASDWEPAEKLLERIQQEKERIGEKRKR